MNSNPKSLVRTQANFKQRGVALWLIFAAIGLLAALAAALSASSRSSTSSTAADVQSTYASAILSQAATLKQGLDHMIVNGTTQATLTFTNDNSTPELAVLDLFGSGNSVLATAPDRAFASGIATPWIFYAPGSKAASGGAGVGAKINGVGMGKNWLVMLKGLSLEACTAINKQVATANTANAAAIATTASLDSVTNTSAVAIDLTTATATKNHASLCVTDSTGAHYFYSVLLEQ